MTTELTKAAQQALEALRANAIHYGDPLRCSRDAIIALERALTQRPAAQTEREAWVPYRVDRADGVKGLSLEEADSLLRQITIPTIRASLPAAQQATPDQFADASKMVPPVALRSVRLTRDTAGMCVVRINGRVAIRDNGDIIDHTATLEWFADTQQATTERHLTVTTNRHGDAFMVSWQDDDHRILEVVWERDPATPEPVGETWGWAIEDKHGVAQAIRPARKEFFGCVQSSEPFTAEDVSKMDCEWAGLAPHRIVTLFTHPAPGVPEGFALVPVEPTPAMKTAGINVEVFASDPNAGPLNWEEVEAVYRAMLAAAQAKGDQP